MYDITSDHWLDPVSRQPTPYVAGALNPKYVVIHTTMGWTAPLAIEKWTSDNFEKESMHLLLSKTGEVTQFASFTTKVWHCGASYYQGHHGLNNWSIGVAIEGSPDTPWGPDVMMHGLNDVLKTLVEVYNIRDIIGHYEASSWTNDPGHKFPLERYKPLVRYGNADSEGRYAVVVPQRKKLNVRGGPDARFEIIDHLKGGDGVKVLRFDFDWAYIAYETSEGNKQGWVHESFLRRL